MRVALAFPACHRRGGVERIMFECARYLANRGNTVDVYTSEWNHDSASKVNYHSVPIRHQPAFLRGYSFFKNSSRQLDPSSYDALGTFGCVSPLDGVHWVQSVHRAWLDVSQRHRSFRGRLKQKLNPFHPITLALERRHFEGKRYRKLIALTTTVKADLMRFYDVPESDIALLPNGYSPEEFNISRVERDRERVRQQLGLEEKHIAIIFVANELDRKGFGPLVRGMASLDDDRLRLIVAGRASPSAYLAELRSLGLKDRVRFVGSSDDVAAYYAAGDVFALPTQYEAWGLVIVEAMACGLPVLTSRLAGAAAAVTEGISGLLLDDPRDPTEIATKLRRLIAGAHADRATIANSVHSYGWPKLLVKYEQIMNEAYGLASTTAQA